MIQFKRGKSSSWNSQKTPLADGQPGYDKDRHKIKIGDGKSSWDSLPNASGMTAEEILDSEKNAKTKAKAIAALNPIGSFIAKALKIEDRTVITYGTEAPDENTIGRIYLQHYDAEPEVDYVVESGISNGWHYQKWNSGFVECCGSFNLTTTVQEPFDSNSMYYSTNIFQTRNYPFEITGISENQASPCEIATLQSASDIAFLANRGKNTEATSGTYLIISPEKLSTDKNYTINLKVEGFFVNKI